MKIAISSQKCIAKPPQRKTHSQPKEQQELTILDKLGPPSKELENDMQAIRITKNNKYLENYQQNLKKIPCHDSLIITNYPLAGWLVGILFAGAGLFLVGHYIAQLKHHTEQTGEIIVSCLVCLFGLSALLVSKKETVTANRNTNLFQVQRVNFFGIRKVRQVPLNKIFNLSLSKKGHSGVYNNTVHYVIRVHVTDCKAIDILEQSSSKKIQKRYLQMTNYFNQDIEVNKIIINDESSKHYQEGFHQL